MPTLSREYDQHFKSFTGIPTIVPEYSLSTYASNKESSTGNNPGQQSSSNSFRGLDSQSRKSSLSATTVGDENDIETTNDRAKDNSVPLTNECNDKSASAPSNYPKLRGSRCFEVLGFDIMIDHTLKPWIIEVNHLPR